MLAISAITSAWWPCIFEVCLLNCNAKEFVVFACAVWVCGSESLTFIDIWNISSSLRILQKLRPILMDRPFSNERDRSYPFSMPQHAEQWVSFWFAFSFSYSASTSPKAGWLDPISLTHGRTVNTHNWISQHILRLLWNFWPNSLKVDATHWIQLMNTSYWISFHLL